MAYVQQTVSTTVVKLLDIFPAATSNLQTMTITVRSGALNILWDGTSPTTSTGLKLSPTSMPLVLRNYFEIARVQMIRDGGTTDAVVDIQFT